MGECLIRTGGLEDFLLLMADDSVGNGLAGFLQRVYIFSGAFALDMHADRLFS